MKKEAFAEEKIYVKSHVPRDLLQNAALFKNEKLAIWEYVSNGLEYIEDGTNPVVKVILENNPKRIVIEDNGRGMNWKGLNNYFIMHGENIDRAKGKPGRGYFGTGKSAAFGIAGTLRITTIQKYKKSTVELKRKDVEALKSEDPIPVLIIEKEIPTSQINGTRIEIEDIYLKSLDQAAIIKYIERHLAKWRKNATVLVNSHECEFIEPPIADTKIFYPEGEIKNKIGNVKLIIKVAKAPLEEDMRGVSIFSNGIWHETTMVGHEGREMSLYIFGEIDVPLLDNTNSPFPSYDLSRNMRLNPSNETVQALYAFLGIKIDEVRRELVKAEKARKQSEEAKKLNKQAEEIARVINEDFNEFRERIAKVKAKSATGFDYGTTFSSASIDEKMIHGGEEPAKEVSPIGNPSSTEGHRSGGKEPRLLDPQLEKASNDETTKGKKAGSIANRAGARGGFKVDFVPMGSDENRANYSREERTIYINIDHPQLAAAKGNSTIEEPTFKKLAYEVAFTEYSIALAAELNSNGDFIDIDEPIVNIRQTINRVARKAAHFYST
ncbi:MAG: ATP-binding protein [Smithella sp.]